MAEPVLELDASLTATPTTYDQPIINAGTVVASQDIRWGDGDSSVGTITNVTRPSGADIWGPELWVDAATDFLLIDEGEQPDEPSAIREMAFNMTSDAVAFATAPRVTVYDSGTHTSGGEEVTNGTTGHTTALIKGRMQTSNAAPSAQYWNEANSSALHDKVSSAATSSTPGNTANNTALEGDTGYMVASTTNINTTPEFFSIVLSVPNDVTPGVDTIDCVLSVRYTFT